MTTYLINFLIYLDIFFLTLHLYFYIDLIALIVLYVLYFLYFFYCILCMYIWTSCLKLTFIIITYLKFTIRNVFC